MKVCVRTFFTNTTYCVLKLHKMMYQKYFYTGRAAVRIPLIFDKQPLCHGKYCRLAPLHEPAH